MSIIANAQLIRSYDGIQEVHRYLAKYDDAALYKALREPYDPSPNMSRNAMVSLILNGYRA